MHVVCVQFFQIDAIQIVFIHKRMILPHSLHTHPYIHTHTSQLLASELGWSDARTEAEHADGRAFIATFCGPVPKDHTAADTA